MTDPGALWVAALELVAATAGDEPRRRNAVSRLYYATFHAVRIRLALNVSGPEAHEKVIRSMMESKDVHRARLGGRLNALRKLRNHADYELHKTVSESHLHSAHQHALAVMAHFGVAR